MALCIGHKLCHGPLSGRHISVRMYIYVQRLYCKARWPLCGVHGVYASTIVHNASIVKASPPIDGRAFVVRQCNTLCHV